MGLLRINILGASGSGTSTVGRALATTLDVPFFDADDYFHEPTDPPFQRQRPLSKVCAMMESDIASLDRWVLAGGIGLWDPCPRLEFTLLVFLWVPTEIRIQRLRRRGHERHGDRVREGGDMHETNEEFIAWTSRYDLGDVEGKTLARHEAYLATQSCSVLEFREVLPVERIVNAIVTTIGSECTRS